MLRQQRPQFGQSHILVRVFFKLKIKSTFAHALKGHFDLQNILIAWALSTECYLSISDANVTEFLENTFPEGHLKTQLPN